MGQPVFGPNDFHTKGGQLMPGLGPEEEQKIVAMRGGGFAAPVDEPPDRKALREKARQLSTAERELEKERRAAEADMAAREAAVAEREALVEAQLKKLEG